MQTFKNNLHALRWRFQNQVHYSRFYVPNRRERIDKSNQGQGIFTGDATSGYYTGIYLADGAKLWYEFGDFFHCQCCSYITITKKKDVKCVNIQINLVKGFPLAEVSNEKMKLIS